MSSQIHRYGMGCVLAIVVVLIAGCSGRGRSRADVDSKEEIERPESAQDAAGDEGFDDTEPDDDASSEAERTDPGKAAE